MKKKLEELIEKYRAQRDKNNHNYETADALGFKGETTKLTIETNLIRGFIADLQELEQANS